MRLLSTETIGCLNLHHASILKDPVVGNAPPVHSLYAPLSFSVALKQPSPRRCALLGFAPQTSFRIESLPHDALYEILRHLDCASLLGSRLVCRTLRDASDDITLWTSLVQKLHLQYDQFPHECPRQRCVRYHAAQRTEDQLLGRNGVTQDCVAAVQRLRRYAYYGDHRAMLLVAFTFEHGYGCEMDDAKRQHWLSKCKHPLASIMRSRVVKHPALLQPALKSYYGRHSDWLATLLLALSQTGSSSSDLVTTGLQTMQTLADQGELVSMVTLGRRHIEGRDLEYNPSLAADYFQYAAQQQFTPALHHLGLCYDDGEGLEWDLKRALQLYFAAAHRGYKDAMQRVAMCYQEGHGLKVDIAQATEWWRRSGLKQNAVMMTRRL